jgi:hypothetical protein
MKLGIRLLTAVMALAAVPATAQNQAGGKWDPRDFEGIWQSSITDITNGMLPGEVISFTPYGAEKHRSFDERDMSRRGCDIKGLQRHMTSAFPSMFVQDDTRQMMIVLHEDQNRFRAIYMDGRGHPEEIYDLPEPFGHSIGRWEGDTLVVDTVGFHDTTWMDRAGLGHSTQLHLIERFKRTGADTIEWTVTVEDPIHYTKPFTYRSIFSRRDGFRLMTYNCQNERDIEHVESMIRGTNETHAKPEFFRFPK